MVFNIWLTLIYGLKKGGERDHIYVLSLSVVQALKNSCVLDFITLPKTQGEEMRNKEK